MEIVAAAWEGQRYRGTMVKETKSSFGLGMEGKEIPTIKGKKTHESRNSDSHEISGKPTNYKERSVRSWNLAWIDPSLNYWTLWNWHDSFYEPLVHSKWSSNICIWNLKKLQWCCHDCCDNVKSWKYLSLEVMNLVFAAKISKKSVGNWNVLAFFNVMCAVKN